MYYIIISVVKSAPFPKKISIFQNGDHVLSELEAS